jgi:hypothetical protein
MKKLLTLAVLLFSGFCISQDLTQNLLLHYEFDGNTEDSSVNGYDAVAFGPTLAADRFGNPNSAYYFDGDDDYINFPNVAALKPSLPVSFSFWVRYDSTSYQDQTVFDTSFEEDHCTGIWFNSTSATSKPAVNFGNGEYSYSPYTRQTFVTDTVIDTNNWYHMIVVVNSASNMKIYVNCKEYGGTYSGEGGAIQYSSFPGCLGRHDRDLSLPPDYFKGYIDDFRYWDKALTTADIAELCTPTLANPDHPKGIGLIAYPNPARDKLYIQSAIALESMRLYNALGQVVYSGIYQPEIDISNMAPGIYYLKCAAGSKTETKKIIIK